MRAGYTICVAMLLSLLCQAAPAAATVTDMGSTGKLRRGTAIFWNGPMVERSGQAMGGLPPRPNSPAVGAAHCDLPVYECFAYDFRVAASGSRLRVAIDHPDVTDIFGFELRAPDGSTAGVATGSTVEVVGDGTHSAEVFVDRPARGRWHVTVIAHDVSASAFRMRAKLERRTRSPRNAPPRDLLPNLQVNPPSRVGFGECQSSEQSQHGARVCLRFAEGPQNVGEGPLLLTVHDVGEPRTDPVPLLTGPFPVHIVSLFGTQYQVVQRSDGTSYEVPAGEFEYHVQHRHYHHSGTGEFELLRVTDTEAGTLTPAGSGPKQGFCMGDYYISRWKAFDNAPARTESSYVDPRTHCMFPAPGVVQMRLSAGWGDMYSDVLEGQYVEFGDNPDGHYVIRATTMPGRDIRESDYTDNVGYTYLRVEGRMVDVLERGIGTDPWDPAKILVHDGRQPAASSPKTVPAD